MPTPRKSLGSLTTHALLGLLTLCAALTLAVLPHAAWADQTNPAGSTITGNPGMNDNSAGETLTNHGSIESTGTSGPTRGMNFNRGAGGTGINTGSISAASTTDAAYGMNFFGVGTASNSGSITASSTSSGPAANASGIYFNGGGAAHNSGSITAQSTASIASGIYLGGGGTAHNSGSIAALSTTDKAYGIKLGSGTALNTGSITAQGQTQASGIQLVSGTVQNSGSIAALSTGGLAAGIYLNSGTAQNSGSITAQAQTQAYGIQLNGGGTVQNSGSVAATSSADYAYGIQLKGGGTVLNTGSIVASVTGGLGNAYGIYTPANNVAATAVNHGLITVSSVASAQGIALNTGGTALNYGSIVVSSTGTASGTYLARNGGTATNYGTITVTSTTGSANGLLFYDNTVNNTFSTANNYGSFSLSGADGAHELSLGSGANVRLGDWALTLRDFSNPLTRPFDTGGTLDFTGGRLILRPGTAAQGFALGQEYAVADMVRFQFGFVQGGLAAATSELPELLEARLSGGTSYTDQRVSLHARVDERTNPALGAAAQAVAQARAGMGQLNSILSGQVMAAPLRQGRDVRGASAGQSGLAGGDGFASAGADSAAHKWEVFGMPYFSAVMNRDTDTSSNSVGMLLGGTYRFNESFAAGVHVGYNGGRSDSTVMDMSGSARAGLLGLHALYNITPEWYMRGNFTGFVNESTQNRHSGTAQMPLRAESEFTGRGLMAGLFGGYAWQINEQNTIAPEVGLSWLWSHQDAGDMQWKDATGASNSLYDMRFGAQDYSALYGTAMLRWRGDFSLGSEKAGSLRPSLGLGVRQTLTSGDMDSKLRFVNTDLTSTLTEDRTTMLAEAGLAWKSGGFSVGLSYLGEFGPKQESHGGRLTMGFEF